MNSFLEKLRNLFPNYRDTPEKRFFKIAVILVVSVVVVMILAAIITFALVLRGPDEVLVPDVATSQVPPGLVPKNTFCRSTGCLRPANRILTLAVIIMSCSVESTMAAARYIAPLASLAVHRLSASTSN